MLTLGIETATRRASVGLYGRAAAGAAQIDVEVTGETARDHARHLVPLIDACLADAAVELSQVDGIAVSIGPGSFTGLRVGLATAKGLAFARGCSLVGVSTLEALAATLIARESAPLDPATVICACLDARKGEVYGAVFRAVINPDGRSALTRLVDDFAATPAELAEHVAALVGPLAAPLVLVGDGAERYGEIAAGLPDTTRILSFDARPASGLTVAELGARRLEAGGIDDDAALAPVYVRASQAERTRASREASADGG